MKILIATSNKGKVREIRAILKGIDLEIITLSDITGGPVREPKETGTTFFENALIKARYYSKVTGLSVIAEDSGLEVVALNGAPGVRSARFAGQKASDEENNTKLLKAIKLFRGGPQGRTPVRANFTACAVVYHPGGKVIRATGKVHGHIAERPAGDHGFGYDPLFVPNGYTKTMAQLGPKVKNKISHRKKAFDKLASKLREVAIW